MESWFKQKAFFQCPCLLSVRCDILTCSESWWTSMYCEPTRILCSCSIANSVGKWDSKKWWTHILHLSPLLKCMVHCPIKHSLTKVKFSDKILRIPRWQKQSFYPNLSYHNSLPGRLQEPPNESVCSHSSQPPTIILVFP